MTKPVFECRMCGQCCNGEGGIVVSPTDMARLCAALRVDPTRFMVMYGVVRHGKNTVRAGDNGACVFFVKDHGCSVHEAKPDICRAWPFFRGNMLDPASLHMAKDFCPGIRSDADHEAFVAEGTRSLRANVLMARDPQREAHALLPLAPSATPAPPPSPAEPS